MKHINKFNSISKIIILIVSTSVFIYACRKKDYIEQSHSESKKDFYNSNSKVAIEVERVIQFMKSQPNSNIAQEFITVKGGFPIWEKALSSLQGEIEKPNKFRGTNDDTTVVIPLVLQATDYVNAFLLAKLDSTVSVQLYLGNSYTSFPKLGLDNAAFTSEKYIFNLMLLDKNVFDHKFFRIKDSTVFKSKNSRHGKSKGSIFNFKSSTTQQHNTASKELGSYCVTHLVFAGCPYPFSEACSNGCDMCDDCHEQLTDCYPPLAGGGFVSPQGGGGTQLYPNVISPSNNNNNEFPFAPDRVDNNGFLLSRKIALKKLLEQNSGSLLPCDSLNFMPLDTVNGYGKMYQSVAQHLPSQEILNRLDSLSAVSIVNGDEPFKILRADSAKGLEVNCDYFPLRITLLPFKNGISGARFTHTELLEYFRLNINSFITPSVGVNFSPYNFNGINDFIKFNQPSSQADGALVHINMTPLDGTIIQSGHISSISTTAGLANSLSFTFSTVWSPLDGYHPVSGNRRFGIYRSPTNPSEFTFYTMGVDRISTDLFNFGDWLNQNILQSSSGFENADELWTDMQTNMMNFVNSKRGSASLYSKQRVTARPLWGLVGQYLMGQISLDTLKLLMGC